MMLVWCSAAALGFVVSMVNAACQCKVANWDIQTKLCKSDFALVGRILRINPAKDGTSDLEYTVSLIRKIKGKVGSQFVFQASPSSQECGVGFPLNSIQLLMGKTLGLPIPSKKFNKITSCDVNPSDLPYTPAQWTYLLSRTGRNSYKKNCDCQIVTDRDTPGGDFCHLFGDGKRRACFYNNAICARMGFANRCGWLNSEVCT